MKIKFKSSSCRLIFFLLCRQERFCTNNSVKAGNDLWTLRVVYFPLKHFCLCIKFRIGRSREATEPNTEYIFSQPCHVVSKSNLVFFLSRSMPLFSRRKPRSQSNNFFWSKYQFLHVVKICTLDTSLRTQLWFGSKMFEFSPFSTQNCPMKQTKLFQCICLFQKRLLPWCMFHRPQCIMLFKFMAAFL